MPKHLKSLYSSRKAVAVSLTKSTVCGVHACTCAGMCVACVCTYARMRAKRSNRAHKNYVRCVCEGTLVCVRVCAITCAYPVCCAHHVYVHVYCIFPHDRVSLPDKSDDISLKGDVQSSCNSWWGSAHSSSCMQLLIAGAVHIRTHRHTRTPHVVFSDPILNSQR